MEENKLYQVTEQGIFETLAGLEKKITAKLQTHGYRVYVQRLLDKQLTYYLDRLTDEDLANLEGRDDQVNVLGLVVDHPGGFIVDCPTGWGKSYAIVQICKILPTSKIAIVAPGKDVTKTLYNNLRRQIRDVGRVGDGQRDIRRITVSTMESVHRLKKVDWDLLLFDEVHRAGGEGIANNIAETFHTAKCVGFSASPTGRTDNSDLVVEALFGRIMYKVTYKEAQERGAVVPIRVLMFDVPVGPFIQDKVQPTTRNRKGIWFNVERNNLIASIASALPDDEQCLIMVATARHAIQLKKLLPDFSVVFSQLSAKNKSDLYGISGSLVPGLDFKSGSFNSDYRDYLRRQFESGKLKKAIATSVWATGVDFRQLTYLIRAEGTSSSIQSIQTPGRLSRTFDGKECGILIDFIDRFNRILLGRSTARRKAYNRAGWDVQELPRGDPADLIAQYLTEGQHDGS